MWKSRDQIATKLWRILPAILISMPDLIIRAAANGSPGTVSTPGQRLSKPCHPAGQPRLSESAGGFRVKRDKLPDAVIFQDMVTIQSRTPEMAKNS